MQDDAHAILAVQCGQDVAGAVHRAVVHKNDLTGPAGGLDAADDLLQAGFLVVDGDYNG